MECPSCHHPVEGNYCSNCSRPAHLERINFMYVIQELGSIFSFKKGFLFTIKELIIRPGSSVRTFLREDRNRLMKPIMFLIFCSFIYAIFQQLLHFEDRYYEETYKGIESSSAMVAVFDWIRNNYGFANIIMGVFIAPWLWLLFRKHSYNFFELLVLLFFIMGVGMLIFGILGVVEAFTGISLLVASGVIGLLYTCWAIGKFYPGRLWINIIKAFLAYLLGWLIFTVAATILGLTLDALSRV